MPAHPASAVLAAKPSGGDAQVGEISVKILDAAEIHAYECAVPDDVKIGRLAARLAELAGMPQSDPNGRSVDYGLMVREGALLDSSTVLADHHLSDGIVLRLLPDITAGGGEPDSSAERETKTIDEPLKSFRVDMGEPVSLLPEMGAPDTPQIRIDVSVHHEIARFAGQDIHTECAGLLLGDMRTEDGERIIHIRAAVPASCAHGTRATIRISHQSWAAMMQERDQRHADLRILGWFHTHAGWGVFLSELDVFIQESFFHHPGMLAYVLDPTTGRDGFFVWQDGQISLANSFTHVGMPAPDRKQPTSPSKSRRPDLRDAIIAVLAACVVYLAILGPPVRPGPKPTISPPTVEQTAEAALPVEAEEPDVEYVVQSGDNPWTICQRVYGNGALADALSQYNGLDNVSGLQIGQRIKLPPREKLTGSSED